MSYQLARILESQASDAAEKCRVLQVSFQDLTPDGVLELIPKLRVKLAQNLAVSEDLAVSAEKANDIDLEVQASALPASVKEAIRKFDDESLAIILSSGMIDSYNELQLITQQVVNAVFELGLDPVESLNLIEIACNLISDKKYGSFQIPDIKNYRQLLNEPLPDAEQPAQES